MTDTTHATPVTTYILEGRVVTMGPEGIIEDGAIYVREGVIVDVADADQPAIEGFEHAPHIRTGDTIFPGFIELHNHLCFNAMSLWDVPRQFTNNNQWKTHDDYRRKITKPTQVLGGTPDVVEALVRYAECRALFGGVTTTQGIRLYTEPGIGVFFKGLVRNVEEAGDPMFPRAGSKIANPSRGKAEAYLNTLNKFSCYLQHISEGIDDTARGWFLNLELENGDWAINSRFCGIHATAFKEEDFQIVQEREGSIVWSPLSNFLLYGKTMDIHAAKQSGVLMGLGSDWAPSGSKNMLGEIKIAWLVSEEQGGVFTPEELVQMATINGAKILKWDHALGSIEKGKRADFVVFNGRRGDPFMQVMDARETSITLIVIDGTPRLGQRSLMKKFKAEESLFEPLTIGSSSRYLYLDQEDVHPLIQDLSFNEARTRLRGALADLPRLATRYDQQTASGLFSGSTDAQGLQWRMAHDFEEDDLTFESAAKPMSYYVTEALALEGITVPDDKRFFVNLMGARNLPEYIKRGLPPLYGERIPRSDTGILLESRDTHIPEDILDTVRELKIFLKSWGELEVDDLKHIVDQSLLVLEEHYVHLPFKKAMHAIDPVQRLRLLRHRLEERQRDQSLPEIYFHNEVARIFNSLRDLHTTYRLPYPFKGKVAWLPFMIETFWERDKQKFLVSKVVAEMGPPSFVPGVEVRYWNGTPIDRVVASFADLQAGGNSAARSAQALNALTLRPLSHGLPPDEEWVTLTYLTHDGVEHTYTQEWLVFEPGTSRLNVNPELALDNEATIIHAQTAIGLDARTDDIQEAKKVLFAGAFLEREKESLVLGESGEVVGLKNPVRNAKGGIETYLPTLFRAYPVETDHGTFAYIRIFTFNISSAEVFVDECVRLLKALPQEGLIIDVRGNGGGLIPAAEGLLQVLSPKRIAPHTVQFINTPSNLALCRAHSPSTYIDGLDLEEWVNSIRQSTETGAAYSQGFPITPATLLDQYTQEYFGPILLITDALCYSATDIFAAGFKDNNIGHILGTSPTTGAGGANVWSHSLLAALMRGTGDSPSQYERLSHGADLQLAIRRSLRTGEHAGRILEDLGVRPDGEIHRMTRKDLIQGNADLLEHAARILGTKTVHAMHAEVHRDPSNALVLSLKTNNITRIDVSTRHRIWKSYNITESNLEISLEQVFETVPTDLHILGFFADQHVITKRIRVGEN